jgi:hypothetical protein
MLKITITKIIVISRNIIGKEVFLDTTKDPVVLPNLDATLNISSILTVRSLLIST